MTAYQTVNAEDGSGGRGGIYRRIDRVSVGVSTLLVFFFVLITHMQFPINQTIGDSIWYLPTAFSLLNERNVDLSEYQPLVDYYNSHGLSYTDVQVNGKPYNNLMPPQDQLTNDQAADALTYVMNSWGNNFGTVSADEVKAVRNQK